MKVAIIGGSAFSTPALLNFLAKHRATECLEIVLASRSHEKLAAVKRACLLMGSSAISIATQAIRPDSWRDILDGVNCVLIQMRVGGFEGRYFDETFPSRYGLCGDEGLGPGGISAAWRTWPELAKTLDAISRFCPKAIIILMTSPLTVLLRASFQYTNLRLFGLCELPWTTLQRLRRSTADLDADYFGMNHLGWFFNFRRRGQNCDAQVAMALDESFFPSSSFVRNKGCLPTRYLRLHYEPEKVVMEAGLADVPRAEVLKRLQEQAYRVYCGGTAAEIANVVDARQTPWYDHAVGPLLLALAGESAEIPFYLSVRHGSYTDLLQDDDVVECRHSWMNNGFERTPLAAEVPQHVADNLIQFVSADRVAAEAITSGSKSLLMEALSLHPWTKHHPELTSMANEIVTYNQSVVAARGRA